MATGVEVAATGVKPDIQVNTAGAPPSDRVTDWLLGTVSSETNLAPSDSECDHVPYGSSDSGQLTSAGVKMAEEEGKVRVKRRRSRSQRPKREPSRPSLDSAPPEHGHYRRRTGQGRHSRQTTRLGHKAKRRKRQGDSDSEDASRAWTMDARSMHSHSTHRSIIKKMHDGTLEPAEDPGHASISASSVVHDISQESSGEVRKGREVGQAGEQLVGRRCVLVAVSLMLLVALALVAAFIYLVYQGQCRIKMFSLCLVHRPARC